MHGSSCDQSNTSHHRATPQLPHSTRLRVTACRDHSVDASVRLTNAPAAAAAALDLITDDVLLTENYASDDTVR